MAKAFIFDMDGTLVDNMHYHERAWQSLLAEEGVQLSIPQVREKAYGKNEESFVRFFGYKPDIAEMRAFYLRKEAKYRELYAPHLALIKGCLTFLEQAQALGVPMAIGTGAMWSNTRFVIDGLDIRRFFSTIITAEEVEHGKPNPETFLKAAKGLGVSPEDCIVFEDVPSGAQAAHAAGMRSVMLTTLFDEAHLALQPSVLRIVKDYEELIVTEILNA